MFGTSQNTKKFTSKKLWCGRTRTKFGNSCTVFNTIVSVKSKPSFLENFTYGKSSVRYGKNNPVFSYCTVVYQKIPYIIRIVLFSKIQPNRTVIPNRTVPQARSQKFAMEGLFGGSGGYAPSRRRPMGVWGFGGKAPSRWRHGGLGAEPPALENFAFFCKNNFILGLFWLKNIAFKTWLKNWQCKHN